MAQALEKVKMSPKLRKMCYHFPKLSLWRNPVFSEVLRKIEKATQCPPSTSPCATNPNNIRLLLQAPEVRNGREAAITDKEAKILKNGARCDRGSPDRK